MKKIFNSSDSSSNNQANKSRKLSHDKPSSDVQAFTSTQPQASAPELPVNPASTSGPATSSQQVPAASTALPAPRRSSRQISYTIDSVNVTTTWQYRDHPENDIMSDMTIPDAVDTTSMSSADKPAPAKASTSAVRAPKPSTSTSAPIPDAQSSVPTIPESPEFAAATTIPSQSQSQVQPPSQNQSHPQAQAQSQQQAPPQQTGPQIHQPTGYTWTRDEDAPGYSWRTKKAQEEMGRAWEMIVDREKVVGKRYGDIGLEA